MRSSQSRERAARAALKQELESDDSLTSVMEASFEAAVLARAYTVDEEGDGKEWLSLLLEARDAADSATFTVPLAAHASARELKTLHVIWKKLDGVISARPGEDLATQYLKEAEAALRRADRALRVAPSQSLHHDYVVRTVTLLWCRYTGDTPSASADAQSGGGLNPTPLIRFIREILSLALPNLTDSEIQRGVSLAK